MSLTVPTSGDIGGRSASVQIATPDTGAVISEFGNKMAELGTKLKAQQQGYDTQRGVLAITKDMAQVRLDTEQLADPAQLGPTLDDGTAAIRAKYITADTPPEVAQAFDLAILDLQGRHGMALAEKSVNLTRSKREADWINTRADITTTAVTSDLETFGALLEYGEGLIDRRVAEGLTDPASGATEKLALRKEVYSGRANALIEADPQAFLTGVDAGDWTELGDDLAPRKLAAEKELARREAEGIKATEVAAKAQSAALKKRLGEMTKITKAGGRAVDETYLNSPEVQAAIQTDPELQTAYGEVRAANALRDELPGLRQMTPAQLDAQIVKEKAKLNAGVTDEYQLERLKVLTAWRDSSAAKWANDKVNTAVEVGLTVPELPTLDSADPAAFAAGLSDRLGFDAAMKSYGPGQGIFAPVELSSLKAVVDPKADTAPKLALATAIASAAAQNPEAVTGLLGADPSFNRAVKIITTTGDTGLAEEILRGQQKDKLGTVELPTGPKFTAAFDEATAGAFEGNTTLKSEIQATARAIYADAAFGMDPAQVDADLMTRSIQRASGATVDTAGEYTVGGVQQINDAFVVLPSGIAAADVESTFESLAGTMLGDSHAVSDVTLGDVAALGLRATPFNLGLDLVTPDKPDINTSALVDPTNPNSGRMRALMSASVDGSAPELGKDPQGRLGMAQLVRVGESDQYELFMRVDGRSHPIARAGDPKRRAWRFRLPDLISATAANKSPDYTRQYMDAISRGDETEADRLRKLVVGGAQP